MRRPEADFYRLFGAILRDSGRRHPRPRSDNLPRYREFSAGQCLLKYANGRGLLHIFGGSGQTPLGGEIRLGFRNDETAQRATCQVMLATAVFYRYPLFPREFPRQMDF